MLDFDKYRIMEGASSFGHQKKMWKRVSIFRCLNKDSLKKSLLKNMIKITKAKNGKVEGFWKVHQNTLFGPTHNKKQR